MMRMSLALAAAATLATACTHTHQVAAPAPLPAEHVSHGRGALEGLGIGAASGAAAGALAGLASGSDGDGESFLALSWSAGEKALLLGTAGTIVGAAVGAVVGAVRGSRDTYERPPAWVPNVAATPTAGGAAATAAWHF